MGRAPYRQLNSDPTVGFALQTESLSKGWGPACGELVIEITPGDCLAGRKVRRQLCGEHQLFFTNRRACCESSFPFSPVRHGGWACLLQFYNCLASKEVPQNLFFNFL